MYLRLRVKYYLFLSDFNETQQNFEKYLSNFMKIRTVEVELFHSNGQTDRQAGRQTDRQT
jgi:hypothetical protein